MRSHPGDELREAIVSAVHSAKARDPGIVKKVPGLRLARALSCCCCCRISGGDLRQQDNFSMVFIDFKEDFRRAERPILIGP